MPEPSATELANEAEQEATVFAQAMNVENAESSTLRRMMTKKYRLGLSSSRALFMLPTLDLLGTLSIV